MNALSFLCLIVLLNLSAAIPSRVGKDTLLNSERGKGLDQIHSTVIGAMLKSRKVNYSVLCPDGSSSCATNQTCCKLSSGEYGCCNLPFAVCCPDHKHCCPNDYYCQDDGTCTDPNTQAIHIAEQITTTITCPDGGNSCPSDETCCMNTNKTYGCCPAANATCCADNIHCCPSGTTCDLEGHTCRESKYST